MKNNNFQHIDNPSKSKLSKPLVQKLDLDKDVYCGEEERVTFTPQKQQMQLKSIDTYSEESQSIYKAPTNIKGTSMCQISKNLVGREYYDIHTKTYKKILKLSESEEPESKKFFVFSEMFLDLVNKHYKSVCKKLESNKKSKLDNDSIQKLQTEKNDLHHIKDLLTKITEDWIDLFHYHSGGEEKLSTLSIKGVSNKYLDISVLILDANKTTLFYNKKFVKYTTGEKTLIGGEAIHDINKTFGFLPKNLTKSLITPVDTNITAKDLNQKLEDQKIIISQELQVLVEKQEQNLAALEEYIKKAESIETKYKEEFASMEKNKNQEIDNLKKEKEEDLDKQAREYEEKLAKMTQSYEEAELKQQAELKGQRAELDKNKEEIEGHIREIACLKNEVKMTNENYDKMKLELELALESADQEVVSMTEEFNSVREKLDFVTINRDKLKQKLDMYENDTKAEVEITVDQDLPTEVNFADSDDEREEDDVSLSKSTDKKVEEDNYDEKNNLFYSEDNKNPLDILSTNNDIDIVGVELDKDDVSCNGEDSLPSDF